MHTFRDKTRYERMQERISERKKLRYSFCIPNLIHEINFALIIRSAVAFGAEKAYVIGTHATGKDFKKITCGTSDLIDIKAFSNPHEFLETVSKENRIIAIDKTEQSKSIDDSFTFRNVYEENICFVFGNESFGIPAEILHNADEHVHIDMLGPVPSINVAASAAIIFHSFQQRMIR